MIRKVSYLHKRRINLIVAKRKQRLDQGEDNTGTMVQDTQPAISTIPCNREVQFQTATSMGLERKMVSYKDICIGVNGHNLSEEDADLFVAADGGEKEGADAGPQFVGDPLCPVVRLTEVEREAIRIPSKRAILVKVLGRKTTLKYFHARLIKLWQPRARLEVIDLDNEYFVIRFEDWDDLHHVLEGGPWMIAGHYIVIQRWQPKFSPYEDDLRRVAVWVRVPGLPIEYYDKRVLWRIGNVLGKTVKVDANTLSEKGNINGDFSTERAKFARICIEVDLNRILISKFDLEGRIFPVEYEDLHLVCFQCGRYGHRKDACPLLAAGESSKTVEPQGGDGIPQQQREPEPKAADASFGPWMIAQRPQRRNSKNQNGNVGKKVDILEMVNPKKAGVDKGINKKGNVGSRFNILQEEDCTKSDGDMIESTASQQENRGDMIR
ncbi:Zinc finger, CCHC-type [Sesbania bispinosa]|nr:Zinc finger, CCHC-type [Sesbania bispinosa]